MLAYLIKETDILTFEAQRLYSYPRYPVQGKIYKQVFAQFAGLRARLRIISSNNKTVKQTYR